MDMYEGIDKVTLTQLIRFSYYVIFHDYKIKAIGGSQVKIYLIEKINFC